MNRKQINIPDTCQIVIYGPTQCGKSIVSAAIRDLLRGHFGAEVVVIDNDAQGISENSARDEWEDRMIRNTVWIISEANEPRKTSGD